MTTGSLWNGATARLYLAGPAPARRVALLIAASLTLRCAFAASTGLGVDEAYLVATGRELALSTYDHPPLAWWIGWLSSHVFGSESAFVVRLPFVFLFSATTWQMFRLGERLFGSEAGFWAALSLNCAPVLGITSATWAVPDAPLMFFMLASANTLSRVLFDKATSPKVWLLAGIWAGLAMLSKYHGVFLFVGTGVFLLVSARHRQWLLSPWPYLAVCIAALVFSPVILWNVEHHFASFVFQSGRANGSVFRWWMPAVAAGAQAVFLLPPIWLALALTLWRELKAGLPDDRRRFLICLGSGPILLFTVISAWSPGLFFHWAAPGYLMLMPLLGAELARRIEVGDRLWRATALTAACVMPILVAAFAALFLATETWRIIPGSDPFFDLREWRDLRLSLGDAASGANDVTFVAGLKWHQAGRIDYALKNAWPVTCICQDPRGYGVLAPVSRFIGQTGLVLVSLKQAPRAEAELATQFQSVERLPDVSLYRNAYGPASLAVFRGVHLLKGSSK